MTTDPRASAIAAADSSLAAHPELLERFIAAAEAAGVIPAPKNTAAGALNRGELVALLDSFDDIPLRISLSGRIGSPGLYRFSPRRKCITAHYYHLDSYRVSVGEFSRQLSAIVELPTQFGTIITADDSTPVRFFNDKKPDWLVITGAEECDGYVQLILEEEPRP